MLLCVAVCSAVCSWVVSGGHFPYQALWVQLLMCDTDGKWLMSLNGFCALLPVVALGGIRLFVAMATNSLMPTIRPLVSPYLFHLLWLSGEEEGEHIAYPYILKTRGRVMDRVTLGCHDNDSHLVILRGRGYVYAHTLCKCIYTNKPCVALKFQTYSNISCTRTLYHRHASTLWALLTLSGPMSVTVYGLKCLIIPLFILLFLILVNSLETQ